MTINPVAASTASHDVASTKSSGQAAPQGIQPQQITTTDFMTLLAAQLKGQDPSNPVDPTTFVTQLAQFVELSQVSNIDTMLQGYLQGGAGASGAPNTQGSGSGSKPAAGSQ